MSQDCQMHQITYRGFAAFELSNGQISLVIIPDLGGKIASIRHIGSDREWLWTNPYLSYDRPIYGASYVREYDFGGVDECFPTVAPAFYPAEPWSGTPVPVHGELWAQPWEVSCSEASEERVTLTLVCHGVRFPYRFERTITVERDRPSARLDYRVINLSPYAMPFLWSIHPLLPLEPGMRLTLPAGVSQIRIDFSTQDWLGKTGELHAWPVVTDSKGEMIDLSKIPPPSIGRGVKLFTLPLQGREPVEAILADVDGVHSFRFRFLPQEVTHVGVWINCAGWTPLNEPPYYNIALEPCIGASDLLTVAVDRWREHGILEPRQDRSWALEILLT